MEKILAIIVLGAAILTSGAVLASSDSLVHRGSEPLQQLDFSTEQSNKLGEMVAQTEHNVDAILQKYELDDRRLRAMRAEIKNSDKGARQQEGDLLDHEQVV